MGKMKNSEARNSCGRDPDTADVHPAMPSQKGPEARADGRPGAGGFYQKSGQFLLKPGKANGAREDEKRPAERCLRGGNLPEGRE